MVSVILTFHLSDHSLVPTCSDNWLPTVFVFTLWLVWVLMAIYTCP